MDCLKIKKKNNNKTNEKKNFQGSELLRRRDSIGVAHIHKSTVNTRENNNSNN